MLVSNYCLYFKLRVFVIHVSIVLFQIETNRYWFGCNL